VRSGVVSLSTPGGCAYVHVYQLPGETAAKAEAIPGPDWHTSPIYSQFSGLWKEEKYGSSTLEHSGCAIFALSHALKLQFDNNPRILQNYFNQPLGVLKAGAYADLIVLEYDPVTPLNDKTMGGHILFGMAGYQVEDSMINGRFVMKDRVILTVDHAKIMAETRRLSQKLWDRL
jgi:hypothetical protein